MHINHLTFLSPPYTTDCLLPCHPTMKFSSKKLKLVCRFNGEFWRRKPDDKPRYTGGDTRIVSVDPTTLTYSKLRSRITELFGIATSYELKLKYQLPGSEGGDSAPLVLLADNDDVSCMVEEYYEKAALFGKNSRLWVYVFNARVDDLSKISCQTGGFDSGFRVLGEKNLGFKNNDPNVVKNHNHHNNHVHNNGRKKIGGSNSDRCLRKLVLRQQLMVAKQRDQLESDNSNNTDCSLGSANVGSYDLDRPLINLGPESWELSTTKTDVNGGSCVRKEYCKDEDFGGVNLMTLGSKSCPLSVRDSNLFEGGYQTSGSSTTTATMMGSCCEGMSYGSKEKVCLNRENPLPWSLDWNALNAYVSCDDRGIQKGSMMNDFHRGQGMLCPCGIRSHQFHNAGHCVGKMCGCISLGARCYPGLGVSRQGQAVRNHHSNSLSRPSSGPHLTKAVEMRKLNVPNEANIRKLATEGSVKQSQVYQCVEIHPPQTLEVPLIDLSEVPVEVNYETAKAEVKDNDLIGSHPMLNGMASSIDLSSYCPSMSSSKVAATPERSDVGSEVFPASSQMDQLKVLDPTIEEKQLPEVGGSNETALCSITDIMAKWDISCSLQEDTQDDSSASPNIDDKVDSGKNQKDSNTINGIPSDLAALYDHLSTRGLQTIQDSDLEYIKELGSGNYGTVYHGKWKGSDVAIKKIKPSCFNNGDTKLEDRLVVDFWKEAYMLGQLHHPNIVAFYGVVSNGPITNLATVTEYMVNGSLKQVLKRKDRTIDRRKRLIIAMDVAFGMEYLHEKNIVHFDLKSHNFLVNMKDPQRPVCKIGDLGLSKIKQRTMVSGGVRGTIPWMAPELLNTKTNLVTEKVDVYSFGVVMWELLTGEEPYAGMHSQDIIAEKIKGTLQPEIPSWCDPAWRSLMERCWSSDPKSRPSFSEIAKELRAISAEMNIK